MSVGNDLGSGVSGRRFLIHACLGRGGFGEVYRATMTSAGGVRTEVAVKILRADIDPGSDSVKRLRDEGRLLGALSHPAILRVHDLVLLQGRVALVTEFVEGEDLDSCMASDEGIPTRALLGVLSEIASALDVAWSTPTPSGAPMHLVHRDVKPANIRVGRHGEVKLLDFGIARATNLDREAHTANNAMLGSYLYMAPERFHEETVAPPSDVYSLGCLLYEGLTGNRLFQGMTLKQIYGTMLLSRKFNTHVEERLQRVPEAAPEPVVALLRSMIDVDPGTRPLASSVARQCEDLIETLSGSTLKRWARSRVWSAQPHIAGTLDGFELSAESFDVAEHPRSANGSDPKPTREDAAIAGLIAFPKRRTAGAGDAFDAPVAGLVSREMERMDPTDVQRARAESPTPLPVSSTVGARPGAPVAHRQAVAEPVARIAVSNGAPPLHAARALKITPTTAPPITLPPTSLVPGRTPGGSDAVEQWFSGGADGLGVNDPVGMVVPDPPSFAKRPVVVEVEGDFLDTPEPIPALTEGPLPTGRQLDAEIRDLQTARRGRTALWAVVGMAAIGIIAITVLAVWVYLQLGDQLTGRADVVVPTPVEAASSGPAASAPAPSPPATTPAKAVEVAAPEPLGVPAVESVPAEPTPPVDTIERGWRLMDKDVPSAFALFDRLVSANARSAEAHYGRGYALMRLSRREEAVVSLCRAIELGSGDLVTEVRSVMTAEKLACN